MGPPAISELPYELLVRRILPDPDLTAADRKNVRLTCHTLFPSTTAVSFKRIYLSRFYADLKTFVKMARRPHLAWAIQEIVWFELGCDGRAFRNMPIYNSLWEIDEDVLNIQNHLADATSTICWLPAPGQYDGQDDDNGQLIGPQHHDSTTR